MLGSEVCMTSDLADFRLNALWESRRLGCPAPCPVGVTDTEIAAWHLGIEDYGDEMFCISHGARARHLPGTQDEQLSLLEEQAQKSHENE